MPDPTTTPDGRTPDREITMIRQIDLGTMYLEPGKTYLLIYDRTKVTPQVISGTALMLTQQGVTACLLGVVGDPTQAVRCVQLDVPEAMDVAVQGEAAEPLGDPVPPGKNLSRNPLAKG